MTDHDPHVYALAKIMATMDGKLGAFLAEQSGSIQYDHPQYTGHFGGYMVEASEILSALADEGFELVRS